VALVTPPTVLIAGAGGQLGRELVATAPRGARVVALDRAALDVSDAAAVDVAVRAAGPAVVINAAAYTAVDRAETDAHAARAVNADGAAHLAAAAARWGARTVHLSTDFVFDGESSRPYAPGHVVAPLGVYGATKAEGERRVLAADPRAVVVRTAWVYSAHGGNFVKTMLRLMATRDEVRVVADQVGTPTWARGLAGALWRVAARGDVAGVHHWTDAGVASWYDVAVAVQEEAVAAGLLARAVPVVPIRTEDYPTPARRPAYSVLDKTASWAAFGVGAPHWRAQLRAALGEWSAPSGTTPGVA
jgi:dTDP-4-dehydrorhamnose reductase